MTKLEFLAELRQCLAGLPLEDIEKSVEYYKESMDDRMEDGISEEEAVAAMGDVKEIAKGILAEASLPPVQQKKEKKQKPKSRGWEILLLILGFPLWFPLLMSFAAIVLSVYIVLWSVVITFYAVLASFGAAVLCGIVIGTLGFATGQIPLAGVALGAGLTAAGLGIFWFHLCHLCARGTLWCGKMMGRGIKRCFVRKEAAK